MSVASGRRAALTPKGQQTRARIIRIAADLMLDHGANATTVEEICTAADVGKSQIYHYFEDKSELVRGVIEFETERVMSGHEPDFERMSSWADWDAWKDRIVAIQRRNGFIGGCPLGSLANELADSDESARTALNEGFDRWERGFEIGLGRMLEAGHLRPGTDVAPLATFLLSSLQGGLLLCQTRRDAAPLEGALDSALSYVRSFAE
ncbi:TetR/AcrR family transcriptional regulator [Humibacter soli]